MEEERSRHAVNWEHSRVRAIQQVAVETIDADVVMRDMHKEELVARDGNSVVVGKQMMKELEVMHKDTMEMRYQNLAPVSV